MVNGKRAVFHQGARFTRGKAVGIHAFCFRLYCCVTVPGIHKLFSGPPERPQHKHRRRKQLGFIRFGIIQGQCHSHPACIPFAVCGKGHFFQQNIILCILTLFHGMGARVWPRVVYAHSHSVMHPIATGAYLFHIIRHLEGAVCLAAGKRKAVKHRFLVKARGLILLAAARREKQRIGAVPHKIVLFSGVRQLFDAVGRTVCQIDICGIVVLLFVLPAHHKGRLRAVRRKLQL